MLTLEQSNAFHSCLGRSQTFVEYVRALSVIGVEKYDSYLTDGHSEYVGSSGEQVNFPAVYEELAIAEKGNRKTFLEYLRLHQQSETR